MPLMPEKKEENGHHFCEYESNEHHVAIIELADRTELSQAADVHKLDSNCIEHTDLSSRDHTFLIAA